MIRKKAFWIVWMALLLAGGGGYAAYASGLVPWFASQDAAVKETVMQTATVTLGDLSITADGSGQLVPSTEIELSFGSSGTLMELLVEVGDVVAAGNVLGWIDDTDARKAVIDAELGMLQAQEALDQAADTDSLEQIVAQAALKVVQAEADLNTAQNNLDDLIDWSPDETDVQIAEANLIIARADYENTVAKANMRDQQIASTRINLEQTIRSLEEAQIHYSDAMDGARDWENNIETTRENAAKSLQKAQESLEIAQANYDLAMIDSSTIDVQNAWVKVLNAQSTLQDLQTPPEQDDIATAELAVQEMQVALQQARLDLADADADTYEAELSLQQAQLKLESAEHDLECTTLVAPVAGTVVEINATVGETASGTVIVLADLETPVVQFWVEESDLNSVAVGHRVNIVFEALPDLTYPGEIVSVDPVLVSVSGTPAVQAWASIDTSAHPVALLGDMNVEVEIVAGEALNALLVPVQALRDVGAGEGQHAVFVVQDSGELEMRMVEVGLMDYVNAEVLSGLARGEVVSTGETTSSSSSSQPSTDTAAPAMPNINRMLGG